MNHQSGVLRVCTVLVAGFSIASANPVSAQGWNLFGGQQNQSRNQNSRNQNTGGNQGYNRGQGARANPGWNNSGSYSQRATGSGASTGHHHGESGWTDRDTGNVLGILDWGLREITKPQPNNPEFTRPEYRPPYYPQPQPSYVYPQPTYQPAPVATPAAPPSQPKKNTVVVKKKPKRNKDVRDLKFARHDREIGAAMADDAGDAKDEIEKELEAQFDDPTNTNTLTQAEKDEALDILQNGTPEQIDKSTQRSKLGRQVHRRTRREMIDLAGDLGQFEKDAKEGNLTAAGQDTPWIASRTRPGICRWANLRTACSQRSTRWMT